MAISPNLISQNKTLIPINFTSRNPKLTSKSSSTFHQNLQSHKRLSISASATKLVSDIQIQETSSNSMTHWGEFANNVSGEWDGYGADFTIEGEALELPENVVPDAYREWEVKVFDWQTQCPTLAKPEGSDFFYKLIKLLPTVGCEADAATQWSVDERNIGGVDNKVSAFGFHTSGCYVAVWPMVNIGTSKVMELEHCLVDPQNRESRVRIVQFIRVEDSGLSMKSIKVFREQWYGPFRNGEQLGGCAIRDSAFAATEAMKGSEIIGAWHGSTVVTSFNNQTNIIQELVDNKPQNVVRDDHNLVMLPKQLWCSLKEENGGICGEAGWLLKQGLAITSRCHFSVDGTLKEVAIGQETLQEV
ncbi:hypothetical protein ACHQM5_015792 [Ranunculus cassubicifolius]